MLYLVSGSGVLLVKESLEEIPQRHVLSQGDFAFLPAWTEHQVQNENDEVDAIFVVFHVGSRPARANLTDWGGAEDITRD
jgi:quercetin dioxygenase-like cupin family protein